MCSKPRCTFCSPYTAPGRAIRMVRAYIRPGPTGGKRYLPVGWYCPICQSFKSEEKIPIRPR
jgi:hypothetical protein